MVCSKALKATALASMVFLQSLKLRLEDIEKISYLIAKTVLPRSCCRGSLAPTSCSG